jgi:hypothetical protein
MYHDRSRSPFKKRDYQTRVPDPRSPEDYNQPHGSPEMFGSGTGRFHSPGSVRHKFFRDDYDYQRPSNDRYMDHGPSPQSPHDGFGARFESCDPQSPGSDRSPDHFTRHARAFNSPNTRRERTGDHIDTSTPDRTRVSATTIDFDGLRDVPVGPRRSIGKIEAKNLGSPYNVDGLRNVPVGPRRSVGKIEAKNLEPPYNFDGLRDVQVGPRRSVGKIEAENLGPPYILIPFEHVPPQPKLTRHLRGMLKTQMPEEIVINDEGWHLYYDNSTNGRLKLKRCYHEFHRKSFFAYELNMQCFLNGAYTGSRYQQRGRTSLNSNGNTGNPAPPPVSAKSSPMISRFAGREIAYPEPVRRNEAMHSKELPQQEDNAAVKDTPSRVLQYDLPRHLSAEVHAQSASPVNATITMLSQRSERDDTASQASGMTRSDSSRIKRDKCHVCRGETGHGLSSLVPCSTCRRKYHRRCHQDPVIPDGLRDDHTWSCRRCVKKGKTHRGKQQDKSVKPPSNLGPVTSENSPLPASLDIDGEKQRSGSDAPAPPRNEAQAPSGTEVNVAQPGFKKPQFRHVTTKPDAEVVLDIGNGDLALSDLDDLVEKSFSAATVPQAAPQSQKPGKFKMTRTKLPPPVQALKAQQAQPEEPLSQAEAPKPPEDAHAASKHNVKDSNSNVPAARNSAADLRALAHKAHETHQSAIRNGTGIGTEGYVESAERQSHDIRSASNTKTPSVEQSTVQSWARQASEHAQGDAAISTAPTRTPQLEIPESPDEVRLGSASRDEATQDPRLLAKHTRVSSGLSAEHMSDASPAQSGKHTASRKSKGPLFSCCSACQKRIPAGPSGMARLCLGCKRKAAATEASQAVDANPGTNTAGRATSDIVVPAEEQRVTPHKDQEHVDSVAPSGADGEKEQPAAPLQAHDSADQASPAPPSTTQAQPTAVGEEDTALKKAIEGGDVPTEMTGPTDESATTRPEVNLDLPLADSVQPLEPATDPPLDTTSELQDHSTHDAEEDFVEITSPGRIEYIRGIVGDSYNRPKGSRTILVAMAMSMFPTQRMQAKDILDWISANIPTCKAGEGNWHERVVSQLTQGTRTKGVGGYWLMEEWKEGDGGVPGKKWYKLLPEKADEMWTWCPLRQRPIEPKHPSVAKTSGVKRQREPKCTENATALRGTLSVSSASTPTTPLVTRPSTAINSVNGLYSSKQSPTMVTRTPDQDAMDVDESLSANTAVVEDEQPNNSETAQSTEPQHTPGFDHASSDDEPLLKRRRRDELNKPRLPRLAYMQQHTPANTEMEELPDAENEVAHATPTEHRDSPDFRRSTEDSNSSIQTKKAKVVILNMRKGSLSDAINKAPVRSQFVTDFYNEWPEYREENVLDEQAKVAEIAKRPTRKQMFGKPALCSRLRVREPSVEAPAISVNMSPEKRARSFVIDPENPYPWEKGVGEEFDTLDEFFDFPVNVIPIISEGQLAYRDGMRNEDGRLRRAREVFKP